MNEHKEPQREVLTESSERDEKAQKTFRWHPRQSIVFKPGVRNKVMNAG